MPSSKPRLYVALYPSGVVDNEERRYHWGLLVGPKNEKSDVVPGMRYHVKNAPLVGWKYEELELSNVRSTTNLLARIMVAKVEDIKRLETILRSLPVIQNDPSWRCRTWIASAMAELAKDGKAVGTAQLDWNKIEDTARRYVAKKTADGRYGSSSDITKPKPTWDLIEDHEVTA